MIAIVLYDGPTEKPVLPEQPSEEQPPISAWKMTGLFLAVVIVLTLGFIFGFGPGFPTEMLVP